MTGMLELTRTVRFSLSGRPAHPASRLSTGLHNGFGGWPAMRGLGRYYELHLRCRGKADPTTGYFININRMDQAVRQVAIPYLEDLLADDPWGDWIPLGQTLRRLMQMLQPELGRTIVELTLQLTPFYRLTIRSRAMNQVVIRQQYEFSAAHRLHVPSLNAQQNQKVFGKCNNPSGHGHNYRLEIAVRCGIDSKGRTLDLDQLDATVNQAVIEKLDHKHLNLDVPQFARLNPSVENIVVVAHKMLVAAIRKLGAHLEETSVWETGKTVCTYRALSRK